MVHGLADETALAGLHAGDSEKVSFSGAGLGLGPLALESAVFVLLFLLVGVFGGCGLGLRKELRNVAGGTVTTVVNRVDGGNIKIKK